MTGILLAWQIAAAPTTIAYRHVPAALVSIHVYAWQDGKPPAEFATGADFAAESTVARVECVEGTRLVVSFARSDGTYVLDGPFDCPAVATERRADQTWRQTLRLRSPPGWPAGTAVSWIPADRDPPGRWPWCVSVGSIAECWGVPVDARGVLVATERDRVAWRVVAPRAPIADFRETRWGRLVLLPSDPEYGPVVTTIAHAVASSRRAESLRLDSAVVSDAHAIPIDGTSVWVYGGQIPASAWIELSAPGASPTYLALEDVALGPASLPLWVTLDRARRLDGVAHSGTAAAAGAVVTLFRLIDPRPPPGDPNRQARRVFASEKIADASGEFSFDSIGDADYEIVAWHPQFGRGIASVARGDTSLTVRLESPGQVRGRVVAAGKPVSGVDVISLPDPDAFAQATDLTEVKGGDARTGPDGRFTVSLAAAGGGEVRVGGGSYPIRRFPLPRTPLPIFDIGDIDLGRPIDVAIVLDRDPGCEMRATGPIGRSGLQVIAGLRTGPGLFRIGFPEEGIWEVHLLCAKDEHSLVPPVVTITRTNDGRELRLTLR